MADEDDWTVTLGERKSFEAKIATDENDLAACGCGANDLCWSAPRDHNAREADHTFEEAQEIGGTFVWNDRDFEEWDELIAGKTFERGVEEEKQLAERNGVTAFCKQCYGSMSPTMVTDELRDRIGRS